ncbi:hypothetical protein CMV_027121, partial [Castanea mollissima]
RGAYHRDLKPENLLLDEEDPHLITGLEKYWPNLIGDNISFWKNQWDSHVACSEDRFDEFGYFSVALEVKKNVDILGYLDDAGIKPLPKVHKYSICHWMVLNCLSRRKRKRVFEEIFDNEWENHNHSFKPSCVLNTTTNPNPPAIESFAYGSSKQSLKENIGFDLEDDDEDVAEAARPSMANRGRWFVVEDEQNDDNDDDKDADIAQVYNVKSSDEE